MSKAGGVVLILSGLAAATYAMQEVGGRDQEQAGQRASQSSDVAKTIVAEQRTSAPVVVPGPRPAYRPAVSRETTPAFSAPVVVTITQRPGEPSAPAPQRVAVPRDRDTLARELQKELRRVGCYEGELNGAWTPSTRRAMKAFTDRINATLPVEEPDPILYTLVQGQQDKVCGKPCPTGQGLSEDGRCLPSAILAKAGRKGPAPAITIWSTTTTATAPPPPVTPAPAVAAAPVSAPPEGRMALAGPTEAVPAAAPPPAPVPAARSARPAPPRVSHREVSWSRSILARRFDSPN
jgi:hypothetical protein